MRLQGKVAIITGSGQGIGAATAVRFAEEGAAVVLAARSEDKLAAVAAAIEGAGGRALVCPTDVSDEEAVKALVAKTVEVFGRLDIVVNNAVLMVPGMLASHDTRAWRKNFIVSLDGAMFLMRESY
ncbi:MAG: SDR family NAD(P)-dependent oxidoreductase, partial [Haliea sp.]|nr:SDR family NAD(P)-dependent oxidoreductase [Haliea sp.]